MNRLRVAVAVMGLSGVFAAGLLAPALGGSLAGGLDFEIFVPTTPASPGDAVDAFGVIKNLNQDVAIEGPIDAEFGAAVAPNSLSGTGWACSFPPPACTTEASVPANEALPALELNFTVPSSGVDFNPWVRCDEPGSRMCLKITGIAFAPRPSGEAPAGSDQFDLPISAPVANLDVAVSADAIQAGQAARYRFTVANVGAGAVDGPIGILVTTGPRGLSNPSVGSSVGWSCDFSRTGSDLYVCERPGGLGGGESAPPLEITWQTSRDARDFACEGDPCINLTAVPRAGGVTGLGTTDRRPVTGPPALVLSDGGASFSDGETGTYTVSLNNFTSLPFWIGTNVVLTPSAGLAFAGFRDATGTWSCAAWDDGQISCELIQALEPGQSSPVLAVDFDVSAPFETTACTEVAEPCVELAAWLPTLDIRLAEQTPVGGSGAPAASNDSVSTSEDTPTSLTLQASDPDGDPLTFTIVGAPVHGTLSGSGANRTYTPNADYHGPDSFTFTANDGTADSNLATVSITVTSVNDAPNADAGGPYTMGLGDSVALDGSSSSDPDAASGDTLGYVWDLDNDTQFDDASGEQPTLTALQLAVLGLEAGTHPIALRVTDSFGLTDTDQSTLTAFDNRPVASLSAAPNPAGCAQLVSFDASGSHHGRPDRTIVLYEWDFDYDGTNFTADAAEQDAQISHAYSTFGTRTVALRVTDDNASPKTDIALLQVEVSLGNVSPFADAGGPYAVEVGAGVTLDASASSDPNAACGDTLSFAWDLTTDGSIDITTSGPSLHLTAAQLAAGGVMQNQFAPGPAIYTISVRVTDSFGLADTDQSTLTIFVNRPFASLSAAPNPAGCSQLVSFDASGSHHGHPDRAIVQYEWDFDYDGTNFTADEQSQQAAVSHAYSTFGTRTVALRVTDDNASPKTDIALLQVEVSLANAAPVAVASPLSDVGGRFYEVEVGDGLTLDGSGSSDPNAACGDTLSFAWDLNNDGSFTDASGPTPQITPTQLPPAGGTQTIGLRVTDSFGVTATDTATIRVTQVVGERVEQTVASGGTATTDSEGDGATANDPIETAVTTPNAGTVSILERPTTTFPATAFSVLGYEVSITAPSAAGAGLTIAFTFDASILPAGVTAGTLAVFRNGANVANCMFFGGSTVPAFDPCVSQREALAGGDIRLTIKTSTASVWTFAGSYPWSGFFSPVDELPTLNSVNAGRAIPVKFSLGGDQGLDIFEAGYPKSQQIACDLGALEDGVEETVTAGASTLTYDAASGRYHYVWKTDRGWAGTCRQLVLKLDDGTFHRANFKFK